MKYFFFYTSSFISVHTSTSTRQMFSKARAEAEAKVNTKSQAGPSTQSHSSSTSSDSTSLANAAEMGLLYDQLLSEQFYDLSSCQHHQAVPCRASKPKSDYDWTFTWRSFFLYLGFICLYTLIIAGIMCTLFIAAGWRLQGCWEKTYKHQKSTSSSPGFCGIRHPDML